MDFKAILLDLDDTLYDYEYAHQQGMDAVFAYIASHTSRSYAELEQVFQLAKNSVKADLGATAASHNRMLYFQRMFEYLHVNAQVHTLEAYRLYWDTFLPAMRLKKGVHAFLNKTKEIPICIVTDLTTHIQHRKLVYLGIQERINYMVTSEEAGVEKPHPHIFQLALNKLGMEAGEVIMIGDHYEKDVVAASTLGITSFWLNQKAAHKNPLAIGNFLHVYEKLTAPRLLL